MLPVIVIPALYSKRQEDLEFEDSLGYQTYYGDCVLRRKKVRKEI